MVGISMVPVPMAAMFWLVIMFEFFERGSYYGMMSVLSIYFTDYLFFSKESVGIIKSVIQPILYFLPILAGAMASRMDFNIDMAENDCDIWWKNTCRSYDRRFPFLPRPNSKWSASLRKFLFVRRQWRKRIE